MDREERMYYVGVVAVLAFCVGLAFFGLAALRIGAEGDAEARRFKTIQEAERPLKVWEKPR